MDEEISRRFLEAHRDGDRARAAELLGMLAADVRAHVERRAQRLGTLLVSARLEPPDVAQAVFEKLLETGPTDGHATSSAGKLLAFCDTVALRLVLSAARKHKRERLDSGGPPRSGASPEDERSGPDGSTDEPRPPAVDEAIDLARAIDALRLALVDLSAKERAVLEQDLVHEERSDDEVAVHVGLVRAEELEELQRRAREGDDNDLVRVRNRVYALRRRCLVKLREGVRALLGEEGVAMLSSSRRGVR